MKRFIYLLIALLIASPAWSSDEWLKTRPASSDQWTAFPADNQANLAALDRLLANYREGMTISYSSATTVSVAAGEVVCSNATGTTRKMRQNTSATDVTFTDIDTGAEEASKTYYVYANCDADATTATFKISLSSTAPTGVTYFKKLGSFYNDSSSNISTVSNDNKQSFGTWTSKSESVTYQALTDGYFIGILTTRAGLDNGHITGYSDSSSTPTTVRGIVGIGYGGDSGSFTIPVKVGDYYKGVLTGVVGSPTATYYFISTGN